MSTWLAAGESPEDAVRRFSALQDAGIGHAVMLSRGPWADEGVATLASCVRQLA